MFKQPVFPACSAAVTGQGPVGADDTMAGNNNADGVMVIGAADRPHSLGAADTSGLLAVGDGFAIGDGLQGLPAFQAERRAFHAEGQAEGLQFALKIGIQLPGGFFQQRGAGRA